MYNHYLMAEAALLDRGTTSRVNGDDLEISHPFLYRPLVEFALHLAPQLCARPLARKWILREAMRGILPETVRTRVGKGGPNKDLQVLFAQPPESFALLAREPILADLGLVDARALRSAVDNIRPDRKRDNDSMPGELMRTLSVEAWLQVRSGRWPHGVIANQRDRPSHPSTDVSVTKGDLYEKVFQAGRDGQ
jgi:asparagine synthase (glutamine-hydrolysing)